MFKQRYRQLVRSSALYDLLVTAPFATPWTFALVHALLNQIHPLPDFQPVHVLFANLLGSIVVVWALLRIWRPEPVFGLFDAIGRALFFSWQLYYLASPGSNPVVWLFAGFEFLFFATQAYGFWLLNKIESGRPSRCRVVSHFTAPA